MKIRNGFVSNSSSSSFVIATSVENHERVYDQLNKSERAVVEKMMFSGGMLFGRKLMVGEEVSSEDWHTLSEISRELEEEIDSDEVFEIWDKYKRMLGENREEVFEYSMDF